MNEVDINQFQFEYDLTWMSFFQNSDGKTYARYGGRDDVSADSFLTKKSLLSTMERVLKLHESQDVQTSEKHEPVAKQRKLPGEISAMKKMMSRRRETCIHCHDVKIAQMRVLHDKGQLEKSMVFTYPSPEQIGIQLDPDRQTLIAKIQQDSAAARAGIEKGDEVVATGEYRISTFADFTRALEIAPAEGAIPLSVSRDGKKRTVEIKLNPGWKKSMDPAWRASTDVVGPNGGFWGVKSTKAERKRLRIADDNMAIRVTSIWGNWTRAAGIKSGDVVVSVDGKSDAKTIRHIHAHLQMNHDWGDQVELVVLRKGKKLKLTMKLPNSPN